MRSALRVSHAAIGFVAVLVGYASSAVIVVQAASIAGASPAQITSWFWAVGLGMGVTTIGLSLRYRTPVLTAWSTSGAALLVTALAGVSVPQAIGAFLFSSVLILVFGLFGWADSLMRRVPRGLAAAMLAGVLLRFGTQMFGMLGTDFTLVMVMIAVYLAARRLLPTYAVLASVCAGLVVALLDRAIGWHAVSVEMASPVFTSPEFSPTVLIGVGIPLFIITMASQNVPGLATMRAYGFQTPASPLIAWLGATGLVLGCFGGFAFNLAAIAAAICMSRDAEPEPALRYRVAVWAGVFYLIAAVFAGTVTGLLTALPKALVFGITGVALFATISSSLASGFSDEAERDGALVTFLCTASGVTLWGVGSAFWGLVLGMAALQLRRLPSRR